MKVSVIVPLYNAEAFLNDCLDCLARQTYDSLELIFINDASSDNTEIELEQLLKKSRYPFQVLTNPENRGSGYSRNCGIKSATGDYVFFLDVDDLISCDCIYTMVAQAQKYNYPDIIVCDFKEDFPTYGYRRGFDGGKYYNNNDDIQQAYYQQFWYEMPWNKLLKRSYLLENSLWFPDGCYFEDAHWSFRTALTASTLLLVPKETYYYRTNPTQKTAINKDSQTAVSERSKTYIMMSEIAHLFGQDNAILWIIEQETGYLLSAMRNDGLPKQTKRDIYTNMRSCCLPKEAWGSLCHNGFPRGLKIVLLYRFLPFPIGLTYLGIICRILPLRTMRNKAC